MVSEIMSDSLPDERHDDGVDAPHAQRDGERQSLFMHGELTLSYMDAPQRVRIRNLSKGGVMVETALPVHIGENLIIELPNIGAVRGRAAWVMEGRFGVSFDALVDPNQVRRKVVVTTKKEEAYVDLNKRMGRPGFRS
jgi:hypothetical protein